MPIISPTTITRNDGRLADRDRPFNARVSICLCTCLCTCLHMCLYTCLYTGQRIVISTLQMIDQFTLPGPLSSAAAMSTALAPEFRPNADDAATAAAQTSRTRAGQGGLQATTATALRVKRRAVSKRCMNVAHSAHAVRGLGQIVADLFGANAPMSQSCTDARARASSSSITASRPFSVSVSTKATPQGAITEENLRHAHMCMHTYVWYMCACACTLPVCILVHVYANVHAHVHIHVHD